jgi:hypothetical protein
MQHSHSGADGDWCLLGGYAMLTGKNLLSEHTVVLHNVRIYLPINIA